MTDSPTYFDRSDAWFFVAIMDYGTSFKPIDLSQIIAAGDMVNHAIFLPEELRQGFKKLITKGLIEIKGTNMRLSKEGIEIKNKVRSERGGLFKMVNNTLKRLNSPRLKLSGIKLDLTKYIALFSDEAFEKGYKEYQVAITHRDRN